MPLVRRTRAILRKAEFGFLGVVVVTLIATPRLNGAGYFTGRFLRVLKPNDNAGDLVFALAFRRGLFSSWLKVGKD